MKILYICNEYPPSHHGGIGSYTRLVAETLAKKGHEIYVIGYGENLEEDKTEVINDVIVHSLKNKSLRGVKLLNVLQFVFSRVRFYFKVKKYAGKIQPDIIETYDWSAPIIFRLNGFRTIIRLHGSNTANNDYMNKKKSMILSMFEKKAIQNSDSVVSVSNHVASITQKVFSLNFTFKTIYNGVDVSLFYNHNAERDLNKILFVGRMHPYKGLEELFQILNSVFVQNSNIHFEFVCSVIDSYREKLLSLVDKKYHSRIEFVGRIKNDELPRFYNSANLSILPSRAEAFPIIPLESMACGTPVIMADRFSAREIVEDNIDGFLVNTIDKEIFTNKILEILNNQQKIDEMRETAREKIVRNFSIDKVINDNINFYKSVLTNK